MRKLTFVSGKVYPIDRESINTDQIIPAHWLRRIDSDGFGTGLFEKWRADKDFVLNDDRRRGGKIILAGPDFGSGSSREHAVWALRDFGIEAVIAPSIADIHYNNLPAGPVVPVLISPDEAQVLMQESLANPDLEISIDVAHALLRISSDDRCIPFTINETAQRRLLSGMDIIDETLVHEHKIDHYELSRRPWMPRTIP